MTVKIDRRKPVWLFLVVAYAFSWAFWIPSALEAQGMALPAALSTFLASPFNLAAFGPFFAALVITFFEQGGKGIAALLKRCVDIRFKKIWFVPIVLVPLLVFGGPIVCSIFIGRTAADFSVLANPSYALIAFFVILLTAGPLQEELGWRGYALPRLQSRFDPIVSSLLLGFFWWLWHLPAVFIPGKFMTGNLLVFMALSVEIMLASILFTWIYNNTNGSILAAMLFHASMNWSIWSVFPSMQISLSIIGFTVIFLAMAVFAIVRFGNLNPAGHAGLSSTTLETQ